MADKYLYYQIDLVNVPVEWNTTICESLEHVHDTLKFLDIYFDDETIEAKAIIIGVGMTRKEYADWCHEHLPEDLPVDIDDSHMLFHECPNCSCRCNCTDNPCSCCREDLIREIRKRMNDYLKKSAEMEEKINNKADKRNMQSLYDTMYDYNARASELNWVLLLLKLINDD